MEISNSSDNTEVGQLTSAPDGQAQTTGEVKDELIPKKDYLELQSQSTKWRQNQIDVAIKLVGKDKSEINTLTDDKLKDIVAKQLFGYSTYDEMVAIEGNDFSTPTDIGDDEDKVRKLEKQVKILSYQQQVKELDNAIAKYKAANPSYFTSTDGEVELKESLKLIS